MQTMECRDVAREAEIERMRAVFCVEFHPLDVAVIEAAVREEFAARGRAPVQEFVGVFVERSLRAQFVVRASVCRSVAA